MSMYHIQMGLGYHVVRVRPEGTQGQSKENEQNQNPVHRVGVNKGIKSVTLFLQQNIPG